jgi:hypothetical protein
MSKKIGSDIDKDIHQELLSSYIIFIEAFSPVLSKVEEYRLNVLTENIIDPSEINNNKLITINKMYELLINMVPKFVDIAQVEHELEKYYE